MENSIMMFGMVGLLIGVAIFALWVWALVDIIGSDFTDIGIKIFWFLLVFFIPFLGFILYALLGTSTKIPKRARNTNQKYDDLERIKQLYDNGTLTEAEFEIEKQKIMSRD